MKKDYQKGNRRSICRLKAEEEVKVMASDPVCKMEVDENKAAATYEYQGKTYYFCAVGCKEKFSEEPEKFLKEEEKK